VSVLCGSPLPVTTDEVLEAVMKTRSKCPRRTEPAVAVDVVAERPGKRVTRFEERVIRNPEDDYGVSFMKQ